LAITHHRQPTPHRNYPCGSARMGVIRHYLEPAALIYSQLLAGCELPKTLFPHSCYPHRYPSIAELK
jgi:hypothetical protein